MAGKRYVAAAVLLILSVSLPAGAAASQGMHIEEGDSKRMTATVSNPLQVPDTLNLEFEGGALSRGLVTLEMPEEGAQLDCIPAENRCEAALEPGGIRRVEFSLTGARPGTGEFTVLVSSDTTGKRSEASVRITVEKQRQDESFMEFLNRILGIS